MFTMSNLDPNKPVFVVKPIPYGDGSVYPISDRAMNLERIPNEYRNETYLTQKDPSVLGNPNAAAPPLSLQGSFDDLLPTQEPIGAINIGNEPKPAAKSGTSTRSSSSKKTTSAVEEK